MSKQTALIKTLTILACGSITQGSAEEPVEEFQPIIIPKVIEKAQHNQNWKLAAITGKHEQVVFMSVSRLTNPDNEIGEEVHPFDQVILIVEGKGKAVLNGKATSVEEGDMIFIPQGITHNVINSNKNKALRLISFYSENDVPNGAFYQTKSEEKGE